MLQHVFLLLLPAKMLFAQAAQAIKIGVSLSLTGKYAELGRVSQNAYRLWEADANSQGGLLGRPVHITIVDDKSDAQVARQIYHHFVENDMVDFILGPYSSEITQAILPIAENNQYPLLIAGASADKLWQQNFKYIFGVYVTARRYAVNFLELLVSSDINAIAVLSVDDIFSREVSEGIRVWAIRFGLKIVYSAEFKAGTPSLEELILRAKKSGAQALMICGHFEESIDARRALRRIGWYPKAFYATVGPVVQKYHDVLNSDSDFSFSSSQWEPSGHFPGAREFAEKYEKTFNAVPIYHSANAYAAAQILAAAINKVGGFDRNKIRDVLSSLDTMTIIGRYGVDGTGKQIRHFPITIQWQNGKKEIVGPKELMTASPIWK